MGIQDMERLSLDEGVYIYLTTLLGKPNPCGQFVHATYGASYVMLMKLESMFGTANVQHAITQAFRARAKNKLK
jgi:hypothetical protein